MKRPVEGWEEVMAYFAIYCVPLSTLPHEAGEESWSLVPSWGGVWGKIPQSAREVALETFWLCKFIHLLIY